MIYSVFEQTVFIVNFSLLGLFGSLVFDSTRHYLDKFKNRFLAYFLESLFWIVMMFLSLRYMDNITKGYLPIYTFLFVTLGIIIYYKVFSKEHINNIAIVDAVIIKFIKRIKKIVIVIIFPKEIFVVFKAIKKIKRKDK